MLKDLIVVELASVLAGPDVGMFFAELGAEVIKVENKLLNGDVTRKWKTSSEENESNISAYFCAVNFKKQYLFLDLTISEDRQKVYDLVANADVVITNFKPGADVKLGMDYKSLKQLNPALIYGVINGYGSESKRVAYDLILQAETGFMSINGTEESGPIKMPVALIDVLAAHQLKEGLLLALLKREKSGNGSCVEVSLYDTALASLKNQATNWLMSKFVPQRIGSLHPNIAPYGESFKTKDGKDLVLAIGTDGHFRELLDILGASQLLDNKNYESNQLRVANRKMLAKELKPYFETKSEKELMKPISDKNLPVGVIKNIQEVFEDDSAQKMIVNEKIGEINTSRVKTVAFKISD